MRWRSLVSRYLLCRVLRFVVAWLPNDVKPPVPEWGAVIEVRYCKWTSIDKLVDITPTL